MRVAAEPADFVYDLAFRLGAGLSNVDSEHSAPVACARQIPANPRRTTEERPLDCPGRRYRRYRGRYRRTTHRLVGDLPAGAEGPRLHDPRWWSDERAPVRGLVRQARLRPRRGRRDRLHGAWRQGGPEGLPRLQVGPLEVLHGRRPSPDRR